MKVRGIRVQCGNRWTPDEGIGEIQCVREIVFLRSLVRWGLIARLTVVVIHVRRVGWPASTGRPGYRMDNGMDLG